MMSIFKTGGVLCIAAFAVACSQPEPQPEPPMIRGEPMYDKYGGIVGCEDGVYIPGAPPAQQCLPPPEDCRINVPGAAPTNSSLPPCPPSRQPRDDRDDRPMRDPTGANTRG